MRRGLAAAVRADFHVLAVGSDPRVGRANALLRFCERAPMCDGLESFRVSDSPLLGPPTSQVVDERQAISSARRQNLGDIAQYFQRFDDVG